MRKQSLALDWVKDNMRDNGVQWVRENYDTHVQELGDKAVSKLTYTNDYMVKAKKMLIQEGVSLSRSNVEKKKSSHNYIKGNDDNVHIDENGNITDHPHIINEKGVSDSVITTRSLNITSLEDLIEYSKVDLEEWEVLRHLVESWEVTISAKNSGTDKPETYTNYMVKAWFQRRKEQSYESIKREIVKHIESIAPKYVIKKKGVSKNIEGVMVELSLYDIHFGQLSWGEETLGSNYNIKIARELINKTVDKLLDMISIYKKIDYFLLPIGHDFFNVNSEANTTVRGTVQHEDDRYKKTFSIAYDMMVEVIHKMLSCGDNKKTKIHLITVGGNHDDSRSFYMGEVLRAHFINETDRVTVDNQPSPQKYHCYGNTLIGMVHQYKKNQIKDLPVKMFREARDYDPSIDLNDLKYFEWHTGHTHAESITAVQDVKIITLPSLAPESDWANRNGYRHFREAQALVYSKDHGKLATFSCPVNQFILEND